MSMESAAYSSLYHIRTAQRDRRPFSWATVKRILAFAGPHRGPLVGFLVLSVVGAFLAVATPLLAGRVVDAIVGRRPVRPVLAIAIAIGVIAVVEAGARSAAALAVRPASARA